MFFRRRLEFACLSRPPPAMVNIGSSGTEVLISKPWRLRKGYFFKGCRPWRSPDGILYDYELYNWRGRKLRLQLHGSRKFLSFNFQLQGRGEQRLDIHRVYAMNARRCNDRGLRWTKGHHVHHQPYPRRRPWTNCRAQNMIVVKKSAHEQWHRENPDVPHCLDGC
jgi:hypothetical protein